MTTPIRAPDYLCLKAHKSRALFAEWRGVRLDMARVATSALAMTDPVVLESESAAAWGISKKTGVTSLLGDVDLQEVPYSSPAQLHDVHKISESYSCAPMLHTGLLHALTWLCLHVTLSLSSLCSRCSALELSIESYMQP